jgi:hypothetical protein
MGIGLVVYYMTRKEPHPSAMGMPKQMQNYPLAMQYWPQQPQQKREGFSWSVKDPEKSTMETGRVGNQLNQGAPKVRNGEVNIPIPVSPEIANLLDLNYKKSTSARRGKLERDDGNPFFPDF